MCSPSRSSPSSMHPESVYSLPVAMEYAPTTPQPRPTNMYSLPMAGVTGVMVNAGGHVPCKMQMRVCMCVRVCVCVCVFVCFVCEH